MRQQMKKKLGINPPIRGSIEMIIGIILLVIGYQSPIRGSIGEKLTRIHPLV